MIINNPIIHSSSIGIITPISPPEPPGPPEVPLGGAALNTAGPGGNGADGANVGSSDKIEPLSINDDSLAFSTSSLPPISENDKSCEYDIAKLKNKIARTNIFLYFFNKIFIFSNKSTLF